MRRSGSRTLRVKSAVHDPKRDASVRAIHIFSTAYLMQELSSQHSENKSTWGFFTASVSFSQKASPCPSLLSPLTDRPPLFSSRHPLQRLTEQKQMPRTITYKSKGKIIRSRNHGRPLSILTRQMISEGLSRDEAIAAYHRFCSRLNAHYVPVKQLSYLQHEARKEYNHAE